jgi:predicted metal-dependent peptidase
MELIEKSKVQLLMKDAYFGGLTLRLNFINDPSCPTYWTDGVSIGFNPEFAEKVNPAERVGVLAHEIAHVTGKHHLRRGERDPKLWNIACDYAINPLLIACGFKLPPGGLIDKRFAGMAAEQIYEILNAEQKPAEPDEPGDGDSSDDQGDEGEGSDSSDDQGDDDASDSGDGDDSGDDDETDSTGSGQQGGDPDPDGDDDDPGECGEVRDYPGDPDNDEPATDSELREAEQELNVAMKQAAAQAMKAGQYGDALRDAVEKSLESETNYIDYLKSFVDTTAKADYRWTPPNRRFMSRGLYLPSLSSEDISKIAVFVDDSPSLNHAMLEQALGELSAIIEMYPTTEVILIPCSNKINEREIESYTVDDLPLTYSASGGAGTDFRPPFEYLDREGISPACAIYFTDLECGAERWPEPPDYPVLWAYLRSPYRAVPPPVHFGEFVEVTMQD